MQKRIRVVLMACSTLVVLAAGTPVQAETPEFGGPPEAVTMDGVVQGFVQNGAARYLGIPFAAPPVGALRWQPPQAPAAWSTPLQATSFANHCPQVEIYDGFNTPSTTEDCLYLNVFAPPGAGSQLRNLPVMFWIYGGGFAGGESDDYDAGKLAVQGNVIVVTINYRTGIFGLFAHPALTAEHHLVTNYGLMDQQFGLQWVHRNIAAFGGNPSNVTIFGESAGAVSVYTQLASPLVSGLFQRAIMESGSFAGLLKPVNEATAEASGEAFATQAGCTDQSASCLRALSVAQILAIQGSYSSQPVVDGTLLSLPFDTAFSSGHFNRVPVIHGTNLNELRWSVGTGFDLAGMPETAAGYQSYLSSAYGANAGAVGAQYPLSAYSSPDVALATVETDSGVSCPAIFVDNWFASYVPTYAYEFHDPNPPIYLPPISFPWGAAHTTELQFLFPGYHGGAEGLQHPLSLEEQVLSDEMVGYWTTFARNGNPNFLLAANWPRYVQGYGDFQFLYSPLPLPSEQFASEHRCAFWSNLLGWPGSL